jgi:2-C-methyl-D-erythritol 4-phosphate cytidylyltransferase
MKKNIAIILAGGVGSRFKSLDNIPKQYIKLLDKMIIQYTIEAFEKNNLIDEIAIVAHDNYHDLLKSLIKKENYTKVCAVLESGKDRFESSLSAINHYANYYSMPNENCNMLFHDAVRPILSQRIINQCVEHLTKYNALDVVIPAVDTIVKINPIDNIIEEIPDRSILYYSQTPQCFNFKTIQNAYIEALKDSNRKLSDDCGVIKKYLPLEPIGIIIGDVCNIKITYNQDLEYAKLLMKNFIK